MQVVLPDPEAQGKPRWALSWDQCFPLRQEVIRLELGCPWVRRYLRQSRHLFLRAASPSPRRLRNLVAPLP